MNQAGNQHGKMPDYLIFPEVRKPDRSPAAIHIMPNKKLTKN